MSPGRSERDVYVIGSGPNGLVAAITMARAGQQRHRPRGGADAGWRLPDRRADRARLPPRRLRVGAADGPRVAGAARPPARGARRAVGPPARSPLAHPLDRRGGAAAPLARRDGRRARCRRRRVAAADGAARRRPRPDRRPAVAAVDPAPPGRAGPRSPSPGCSAPSGSPGAGCRPSAGRALFAGLAAHSVLPLDRWLSSGVGLTLAAYAHLVGWPVAEGGSQAVVDALVAILRAARRRRSSAATASTTWRRSRRTRSCSPTSRRRPSCAWPATASRPGPAGATSASAAGPARSSSTTRCPDRCRGAIPPSPAPARSTSAARSRRSPRPRPPSPRGGHPVRPFVLAAQATACDPTRAPAGRHTLWAYCHVPQRLDRRHDRGRRGPDRALRARLPRRRHRPPRHDVVGARGLQRQLHRRRHHRRPVRLAPARDPPGPRPPARGARRSPACTCARRRPRPAVASTACAACHAARTALADFPTDVRRTRAEHELRAAARATAPAALEDRLVDGARGDAVAGRGDGAGERLAGQAEAAVDERGARARGGRRRCTGRAA